ncbi:hypothetical protein A33Q_0020 [Indibacter alkaliphilus LW1]|uniref:DNA uptake protein ComE n=1 Tax=Indibacter alkaliphilus (strain CCUG 57479 / KCTC 22604 / LW1) TaxID=1189612 RepID=S2E7F5_INDAL|nr:helix-hairpin-helix domain-containing protein [Indibacter alkaliphilus]EPA00547.1 hypothetical protein A33Q_0020 [Indibacter alkaliphilus LW1]
MKARIYFFLKTYFGFTKRESRGFILIVPVFLLLYFVPDFYGRLVQKQNKEIYEEYQQVIDSMVQAGFLHYKPDFVKENSLLPQDTLKKKDDFPKRASPKLNRLNFNEADSVTLQVVPGIGQTLAGRIVKFREGMGGMLYKEQLLEVYGLKQEVMERIFDYFEFQPGIFRLLDINHAEVAEIAKHPYVNYGAAKVIVAYRDQHGPYSNAEDLLKIKIFNEEWLDRLRPYLKFD